MTTIRECEYCFKELTQKPEEHNANFASRRFCDKACASKATPARKRYKQEMPFRRRRAAL